MPVFKSLSKIQKKTKDSIIHPRSRNSKQLTRATLRQERLGKKQAARADVQGSKIWRFQFFQHIVNLDRLHNPESQKGSALPKPAKEYTLDDLRTYVEMFLSTDKKELEKLQSERRPGRPASAKQDKLQIKIDAEQAEYKSGFLVPDLTDVQCVEALINWKGDLGGLNVIKTTSVAKLDN